MIKGNCVVCNTTKCRLNSKKLSHGGDVKPIKITPKTQKILEDAYYNPETGFCGINELQRKTKKPTEVVKKFLNEQDVYTLHKPARKNFKSERVYVHNIDEQWQSDLVEMIPYAEENKDFKYLLTVIDCFNAKLCKKLVSEVSVYTDLSGYEHLVEKELNHYPITLSECREMINNKKCDYGTLSKGTSNTWSTNNKIDVDYPNRFTSIFTPKRYYKENCIVIETKVYSHFNQSKPTNILANMNNCKYQDGFCDIKKNEIITWDVNRDQKCQYISIGILDGIYNNKLWVNNKNQIALNFQSNKTVTDCNIDLMISDEGFAVRKINRAPSQYAPSQIPVSIPTYPQRQQHEDDRRKREQEEQRKRDLEERKREQERQKQYEADLKDFEKRKQEKLKKEEEFEKKKQEKTKKAQEEAERKEVETLKKQRKEEDWTVYDKDNRNPPQAKSNRTKREIADLRSAQKEPVNFQPLPLPNYDEYLKIKQDCDNLPSYEAFKNSREGCDSLTSYTDFINNIANYEKEQHSNSSTEETWQPLPFPGYEEYLSIKEDCAILPSYDEYKTIRESCDAFPIRHTTEVMCDIFNEQNEVLESLIRESPRRYIQKQLNHTAIKVRFIDSQESNGIVQVTFCKEIDEEEIDFIDLTRFDGYKLSLALTLGQIPIKIKSLGDKIWYFKNDYSGGIISNKPQLHPMIDFRTNITNMKDFKEFDLKFLDDKVVFNEHILLDMKTNIEEELIEEMREKSDVSIEIHASNQDSTMSHEILDDVEGFFGKWWLRIWRVGVTLPAILVYLFIARSFWMILSPKTFIDRKNRKRRREYEAVELREMVHRPSVQSLTVD
ncbi:Protein CBG10426 [Caenorhabditis briggsae]|uniref:Protein CBG10426 n=1 Tax=Caenorhabditis briggsae TaxID=6238 RepID=A8XB67_CAEBR|nr:Protein CBG10426 [Caenorhabditis briggsae]CAP29847.1 Protein CBG10426 [Caenorhabditis briggsae]